MAYVISQSFGQQWTIKFWGSPKLIVGFWLCRGSATLTPSSVVIGLIVEIKVLLGVYFNLPTSFWNARDNNASHFWD